MSFIDTIEIKNFKSIRHQKIEGCKRINLFIGYPNVGKSNILEALGISMYGNTDSPNSLHDICRFKELSDLFFDGNKFNDAEFWINDLVIALRYNSKVEIEIAGTDKYSYVEKFNENNSRLSFYRKINANGNLIAGKNADGDSPSLDIRKYKFISAEEMKGTSSTTGYSTPKTLAAPIGENLSEVLRFNKDIRIEAGKLFADYNLKLVIDDNQQLIVQKQLDDFTAFQFSYMQVADTLQRLIFYKAAVMSNKGAVLVFEEPESHMFPPYISKLTADLMFDERKNQYFLTTHSPFVLNDFMEELTSDEFAIYAVGYNKTRGETIIRRFADEEIKEAYNYGVDLFFNLEDYLKDVVT